MRRESGEGKWGLLREMSQNMGDLINEMDSPVDAAYNVIMDAVLAGNGCLYHAIGLLEKCKLDAHDMYVELAEEGRREEEGPWRKR